MQGSPRNRVYSLRQLGVFVFFPGWDISPSQDYPKQYFNGAHLYARVERGTIYYIMRVKCLAQEHNTVTLVRAQTRTV